MIISVYYFTCLTYEIKWKEAKRQRDERERERGEREREREGGERKR